MLSSIHTFVSQKNYLYLKCIRSLIPFTLSPYNIIIIIIPVIIRYNRHYVTSKTSIEYHTFSETSYFARSPGNLPSTSHVSRPNLHHPHSPSTKSMLYYYIISRITAKLSLRNFAVDITIITNVHTFAFIIII